MNLTIPTHDEIAARAFERFSERGGRDGHDLDDWLEAERELLEIRPAAIVSAESETLSRTLRRVAKALG